MRDLYLTREWTAAEIAAELNTTSQQVLRALHEHGIPVRPGGPPRKRGGDQALQRLTALYQDPDVAALLQRHRIPTRPEAGPAAQSAVACCLSTSRRNRVVDQSSDLLGVLGELDPVGVGGGWISTCRH